MKNLHKKISAVALIVLLGAPVLSQGFVAHASSSSLNNKSVGLELKLEEFLDYKVVKEYQRDYRYGDYDALYLGKYVEPDVLKKYKDSKIYREFRDRWEFVEVLKKGGFNIYKWKEGPIIVKVGNLYFKFFFHLSGYQRQRILMDEFAKHYGFEIVIVNRIDNYSFKCEMRSKIEKKFADNPRVMKQLLREPRKKGEDIFEDPRELASALELGKILLEKGGYYRFRVGIYDYILHVKKPEINLLKLI